MTTVAMNNLLNYIAGLNLSQRNRTWLAERIVNLPSKKKEVKDPTLMTEEEFFARIDRAEEQLARGEGITFTDRDAMNAWLNSL
ncbi:MAG: hypothetical protein IJT19_07555 [Bacteroidaceae bacterium]|nr:hypothetical protein [Bacteroidaceae bacterium]